MRRNSLRTPEEIEEDIARTRTRIDSTLKAIESRFTPGQVLDQGLDYLRHSGANEFASNLGTSVKQNPLPVSLLSVGLAWLMLADKHPRSYAGAEPDAAGYDAHPMRGRVHDIGQSAAAVRQNVRDTAHAARDRVKAVGEGARHIREGARHQWERAHGGYQQMLREQPLALGAIGLAVGALLAAVVPRTRQEDELMGETRDRMAEEAKAAAKGELDKLGRVAAAAGGTAEDAARREGLTGSRPEPLTPAASQTSDLQGSRSGHFESAPGAQQEAASTHSSQAGPANWSDVGR